MKRLALVAALVLGSLLFLDSCATDDDDPFPTHPATSAQSEAPVAGEATPAPGDASGGWKW